MHKRDDGLVIVDTQKCTGCENCVEMCPYECIFYNRDIRQAQKCTGCAHLLDTKGWTETRCVDNCPTEAIAFGEEEDLKELIARAEVLHPEYGTRPRVYYIGLPKRFIAGTVYDPVIEEIVEDAVCTLTALADGGQATVKTDDFGDFWFEDLAVGEYSLVIETDDGRTKTWDRISTDDDVNLGDIPLATEVTA
jgi:NAD-dependent dihydropyrimidine dehydrogenase PreA subunit